MQDSDSRWEGFDIPLTETDSRQKKACLLEYDGGKEGEAEERERRKKEGVLVSMGRGDERLGVEVFGVGVSLLGLNW